MPFTEAVWRRKAGTGNDIFTALLCIWQ